MGRELPGEEMWVGVAETLGDLANPQRRFLKQDDGMREALLDQPLSR